MLLDNFLMFESFTTPVAITTGGISTNVLDLLNERDIGIGDDPALKLLVLVTATFTSGSTSKMTSKFQGAVSSASGTGGTYSTYAESADLGTDTLVAGAKIFNIDVAAVTPMGINASFGTAALGIPRYLRMSWAIGTTSFTNGSIAAGIIVDRDDIVAYPPGVAVLN